LTLNPLRIILCRRLDLSLLEHTMLIELDYPTPNAVELQAADTLLLIIDMENENAHPSGALFIGEPVRMIIPKIADASARSSGRRTRRSHAVDSLAGRPGVYGLQEYHAQA
jgi:hypothetical protein